MRYDALGCGDTVNSSVVSKSEFCCILPDSASLRNQY